MENEDEPCLVLLLDDDEDDYQLMKAMFQEAFGEWVKLDWFQHDHFSTTMICSGIYALTLVEYRLGPDNGLEIIRKVKAECPDQKIFLVTDWHDPGLMERVRQVGADGHLNKNDLSISSLQALLAPFLC